MASLTEFVARGTFLDAIGDTMPILIAGLLLSLAGGQPIFRP